MKTVRLEKAERNEKSHKRSNYAIYFYTYLATNLIAVIVNSSLPIYFYDYLNVDKTQLAFSQVISYSALFIKPIISVYFDRNPKLKFPIRLLLVGIGLGIVLSFIAFLLTLPILLVFGIFLGINFAFTAVIDVIIKKVLIKKSPTEKQKIRNVLYFQAGSLTGAFLPPIFRLILPWNMTFLASIIVTIPLIVVLGLMGAPEYGPDKEKLTKEVITAEFSLKTVGLMCFLTFLLYADQLYQYPLEPYLVELVGEMMFYILFMGFLIINTIGIILAGLVSHKWNKNRILLYTTAMTGVFLIMTPFISRFAFLILYAILMVVGGFILMNLISLMIDISKERITIFQSIAVFVPLAKVTLVPLGTFLSAYIPSEWIIFIAGVLFMLAVVPLLLIQAPPKVSKTR
jgi:MFS family permease